MFTTQLFNLLDRYYANTIGNPVAKLVLHHGSELQENDDALLELENLFDVSMSSSASITCDRGALRVQFPGLDISIQSDDVLHVNGYCHSCIRESWGDFVSYIDSGEVIIILPKRFLEVS